MRLMVKSALVGVLAGISVVGGVVLSGCAAKPEARVAPMSDADRALAIETFDYVWTTIRDKHFDPTLNGVDWEAVRTEFRPKVEAAVTASEARDLTNAAIERLGQSHFGIIAEDAYEAVSGGSDESEEGSASGDGDSGLAVRLVGDEAVITHVEEGSAGAQAGVKPGWKIISVNGKQISTLISDTRKAYAGQVKERGMVSMALTRTVSGAIGDRRTLECAAEGGRRVKADIVLGAPTGKKTEFGNLPPMYVNYGFKRLDSGVGYTRLSVFFDAPTILPWFEQSVKSVVESRAPGMIIDLRGNIGGIGGMAMAMGGWLVSEPDQKLGTMITRQFPLKFVLNPRVGGYRGPVAILVDEASMSTSEIMAGGLRAIGRARVFGVRTPGMALPSIIERLPTGDGFQYATANYISADDVTLEGHGVLPDEVVEPDPAALLQGRDAVIEAAERWILAQNFPGS